MLEYYNSQGYRDAAITDDTSSIPPKAKKTIDIKVDEGHKYYFGNIRWKGNTKYSDSLLTLIMGIHKGDVYNLDILNKKLGKQMSPEGGDISGLYMDDGYLFLPCRPRGELGLQRHHRFRDPHEPKARRATIKNVTISGNEKTKEYVIRRELRTVPGDKFSRSDLVRSQREIANLGFFNQEKINPAGEPQPGRWYGGHQLAGGRKVRRSVGAFRRLGRRDRADRYGGRDLQQLLHPQYLQQVDAWEPFLTGDGPETQPAHTIEREGLPVL